MHIIKYTVGLFCLVLTLTANCNTISSWDLSGAISAQHKKRSWTASINWRQQGMQQYQIRLFGPIGSGTVIISKKNGVVTFKDGKKIVTSQNDAKLFAQQTGVSLPVGNLYYWMRSIPAPGKVEAKQHYPEGQLYVLKQAGYTIEYNQYVMVNGVSLPSKLRLSGNGILIKLFIKRWGA